MSDADLREPTFLILTALAGGPLHGYAVIQEVAALSDGRVRLKPGSLYGTVDRLLAEGLIVAAREETVDGRRRQYLALSESGADVLQQVAERRAGQAATAMTRLASRHAVAVVAVPR